MSINTDTDLTFNSNIVPMIIFNRGGSLQKINEAAFALFESKDLQALSETKEISEIKRYLKNLSNESIQFTTTVKEKQYQVLLKNFLLQNEPYHLALLVSLKEVFENHQKEMELQAQLLEISKYSTGLNIASGMAHEINNPLTILTLSIEGVEKQFQTIEATTKIKDLIEKAKNAASRIREIVKNLQRKMEDTEVTLFPTLTDVREVISFEIKRKEELLKTLKVDIGLVSEKQVLILGNANDLQKIICEFFQNALESFEKDMTENKISIEVMLSSNKEEVILLIQDNGRGIAKENISKIYEPFFTTKWEEFQSKGLGLTMAYELVKKLNGHIHVKSEVAKGTSVELRFPNPQNI